MAAEMAVESTVKEGAIQTAMAKEEAMATMKGGATAATDHADPTQTTTVAKEEATATAKEEATDHQDRLPEDSGTPVRRASTERT